MTALSVVLCLLLVLAVAAIAVWMWWSMRAPDQVTEQLRIAFEEQVALWRIQVISRRAQAEMRRIRNEVRPRSLKDL
jgi:hypothetical protein